MGTRRHVEKLLSVFDLKVSNAPNMPGGATARVLFIYNKETNQKKFNILVTDMPRSLISSLISWLEMNIEIDDLAFGLKSNRVDVSWPQLASQSSMSSYVPA